MTCFDLYRIYGNHESREKQHQAALPVETPGGRPVCNTYWPVLLASGRLRLLRGFILVRERFVRDIFLLGLHQLLHLIRPCGIPLFVDNQGNDEERKRHHDRKDRAHGRAVIDGEEARDADHRDQQDYDGPEKAVPLLPDPERPFKLRMGLP